MTKQRGMSGRESKEFLRLLAHEAPTMENARREIGRALASGEITHDELDRFYEKHWAPPETMGSDDVDQTRKGGE